MIGIGIGIQVVVGGADRWEVCKKSSTGAEMSGKKYLGTDVGMERIVQRMVRTRFSWKRKVRMADVAGTAVDCADRGKGDWHRFW